MITTATLTRLPCTLRSQSSIFRVDELHSARKQQPGFDFGLVARIVERLIISTGLPVGTCWWIKVTFSRDASRSCWMKLAIEVRWSCHFSKQHGSIGWYKEGRIDSYDVIRLMSLEREKSSDVMWRLQYSIIKDTLQDPAYVYCM